MADRIVLGLGNPGREYEETRHNVGYRVVEELARRMKATFSKAPHNALAAQGRIKNRTFLLVKPLTYMNNSGEVIPALRPDDLGDLLVVVDDFALELGRLRLRPKGSDGGHNGLASLIAALGSQEFARLRIGIGKAPTKVRRDYVLSPFTKQERPVIEEAIVRAADCVATWALEGIQNAMNKFNTVSGKENEP